ncbi:MAG: thioredoxin family protein [Actinomycetota bacterium]|nr:thioredoxin family protein [Actinomycetota bacterium]
MIHVELLTVPGCEACVVLRKSLLELQEEQPDIFVEEVDVSVHRDRALHYGLMACPALAIDGRVEAVGAVRQGKLRKMIARRREAVASSEPEDGTRPAASLR